MRRLLLAGGVVGLVGGVLAQGAVDARVHGGDIEWLVRAALVLPSLIFGAWWLLSPGISLEEPEPAVAEPIPAQERLERIEATFDSAAVPRTRRVELEQVDELARSAYRDSIRRDAELRDAVTPESFGVRRPAGPIGRTRDAG